MSLHIMAVKLPRVCMFIVVIRRPGLRQQSRGSSRCWMGRLESLNRKAEGDALRAELDEARQGADRERRRADTLARELSQAEAQLRSAKAQKASLAAEVRHPW
jgi:hypothetical protein